MVQPDDQREHGDDRSRVDQQLVAEQSPARERRHDFGIDAKRRQNQDVDFGMAPDPEQADIVHYVAAVAIGEKVHAEIAVETKQRSGNGQSREGEHYQDVGAQRRPGEQRHHHQPHAGRAPLDDSDEEIDPGQHRADAADQDRPDPVIDADARTELRFRVGRVSAPASGGKLADDERDHNQSGAGRGQPQAHRVHERERHLARTDLLRNDDVEQADQERHRHEEDHDGGVGGENLIEMVRRQIAMRVECDRLLGPHHHGIDEAAHQHDQRQRHVHDADLLMVEARQPFGPQIAPLAEPGDERNHAKCAEHSDQCAAHGDATVKRQGVNRQLTEHVSSLRTGWGAVAICVGIG